MTLRVMTYNIKEGAVGREAAIIEVAGAAAPDLLCLQEVLDQASATRIAEALGMALAFAQSNAAQRNVALLSRLPIVSACDFHPFPLLRTLLLATVVLPDGQRLNIFGLHLGLIHDLWRTYELLTIVRRIQRYTEVQPTPLSLIAGDFNSVAPGDPVILAGLSPGLRAVLALQFAYAPRLAIRLLRRATYIDCYRAAHPDEPGLTLPTTGPRVRLDYIFASPPLAARLQQCQLFTPPAAHTASDHFPLLADFQS